jgi:hypothetical protein
VSNSQIASSKIYKEVLEGKKYFANPDELLE